MSDLHIALAAKRDFEERMRVVAKLDGRYHAEAYSFVLDGLNHTLSGLQEHRHVEGRELLEGIRELAKEKFGLLARTVLANWGISTTRDFGEIVFTLVNYGMMAKTDDDEMEDFDNVYEFKKAFDEEYLDELSQSVKLDALMPVSWSRG